MIKPLTATIRWIDRHVRGFYAAVGSFLLFGFLISIGLLALLALLARLVARGTAQSLDTALVTSARSLESPVLDAVALLGAVLGSGVAGWVVVFAGTAFLWKTRHRYSVYLLWLAIAGARVLNGLLKDWFDRPRPELFRGEITLLDWTFSFPASYSFPSGHALTSAVIFFTLAFLVARLEPAPWQRRLTLVAAVLLVLMVGFSRVYIGVHYPTDVLAGFLVGLVWAIVAALGIEALRYFRSRHPEIDHAERDLDQGSRPLREAIRP
ncbi:MAG: phosphatase PAP2 family protein [Gemmatimonadota bacterium]